MKALFLESIHEAAAAPFIRDGYEVRTLQGSLDESALIEEVKDVEVLGIRSKTRVTARVLDAAPRLLVVGAFCIGTDQIELPACSDRGIAVFVQLADVLVVCGMEEGAAAARGDLLHRRALRRRIGLLVATVVVQIAG